MKSCIVTIFLFCWSGLLSATISTDVEPNRVSLGETFRVVFTVENDPSVGGMPDLTPLQRDFTILGTERNESYSIINGQAHSVMQWGILLSAKKIGELTIPAIHIGSEKSTISHVTIVGNTAVPPQGKHHATGAVDEVLLNVETDPRQPFVNQQVIYTVRLYNSQRLLDATYQPPRVEDALLIPMGDGRRSQTFLNGQRYEVEEQQYAIFPQKSGLLTITAPSFNALVYDVVPRRISVHADTQSLAVKPMPADYKGAHWLPAKALRLIETYDNLSSSMLKGGTLVRTVRMEADGVPGQLLPALSFKTNSDYSLYLDKPVWRNKARQQTLVGSATTKVTYLLNKAGQVTIPALHISWFNTVTGKEEEASLPARTIDVRGAASVKQRPSSAGKTQKSGAMMAQTIAIDNASHRVLGWRVLGVVLVFLLASGCLYGWFRISASRRLRRRTLKRLRLACFDGNPQMAREALLSWARVQWPEVHILNLHDLIKRACDASLEQELNLLSDALYGHQKKSSWQGEPLWNAVWAYAHHRSSKKKKTAELPPINPT